MDFLVWILVGSLVGWVGYAYFGLNEARGRNVSIILGAAGALIGIKALAPMVLTLPAGGELSATLVFFAAVAAAAVLALGNVVSNRWGV